MDLFTCQIGRWRDLKTRGIELIDTTTRSGVAAFAPGWDIVLPVKSGEITPEQYTVVYLERMEVSRKQHLSTWLGVLQHPRAAITCYCKHGVFCHRHLMVPMFQALGVEHGIEVHYLGEIVNNGIDTTANPFTPNACASQRGAD